MITKEELVNYICENVDDFHFDVKWYGKNPPYAIEGCIGTDYETGRTRINVDIVMKQDKNNIRVVIWQNTEDISCAVRIGYTRINLIEELRVRIAKTFFDYLQLTNFSDEQEALNNTTLI